jgi:hypothetical protein
MEYRRSRTAMERHGLVDDGSCMKITLLTVVWGLRGKNGPWSLPRYTNCLLKPQVIEDIS